jgi:hypothetical protein
LAKRYYDKALSTNPSAQLPVALALAHLQFKYFWHWVWQGGPFWLDPPSASQLSELKHQPSLLDEIDQSLVSLKPKPENDALTDDFGNPVDDQVWFIDGGSDGAGTD